jgi:hypothetical protein
MRPRWWDGCTREVVTRRRDLGPSFRPCWVETLDCGHEQVGQPGTHSIGIRRVCWECVRDEEARP